MMKRMKKGDPLAEAGLRYVDFKDEKLLSRFITDRGKILPARLSGVRDCARAFPACTRFGSFRSAIGRP